MEAEKSLMNNHHKIYDDSKLRRKIKCLVSGLVLCFIISVVSVAIAVMLILQSSEAKERTIMFMTDYQNLKIQVNTLEFKLANSSSSIRTNAEQVSSKKENIPSNVGAVPGPPLKDTDQGSHKHHNTMETTTDGFLFDDDDDTNSDDKEGSGDSYGMEDHPHHDHHHYHSSKHDGLLEEDSEKGESDDKCPPYTKPNCPETARICMTKEACPKEVCCFV